MSSSLITLLAALVLACGWISSGEALPETETAATSGEGACCLTDSTCLILSPASCLAQGGSYRGDGSSCAPGVCEVALTPIIAVMPGALDFRVICPAGCRDLVIELFNNVNDPGSYLEITDLTVSPSPPFELVDPPWTPFKIPGNGTLRVPITARFCPTERGPQDGTFTITSSNASNSPLLVPLGGVGNRVPICDAGGPYVGVVNRPLQFDGTSSSDLDGGQLFYLWDFGDGGTGSGVSPTHTYVALGNYQVTLTVTDLCGEGANCMTEATIVSNIEPVCDAGGPYAGRTGVPITFDGSGSRDPDGVLVSFAWDFGDGGTATGSFPSHTYGAPGSYTVLLAVTDDQGATSTCETQAEIGSENQAPVCNPGGPYVGSAGVPITFNGSGSHDPDGVLVSLVWDFGDGASGTGTFPTHTYAAGGSYTVLLAITDDQGATSTCETQAEVEPGNQAPACDAGGPYVGSVGVPITFDGSGSHDPDGTIVVFNWVFGDCQSGTGVAPSHTYEVPGEYLVRLCVLDNDGGNACCDVSVQIESGAKMRRSSVAAGSETGSNPNVLLPLHAAAGVGLCATPVNCRNVRPTVNVLPNTPYTIYLMIIDFIDVTGIQTAFDWDLGWTLTDVQFNCRAHQVNFVLPDPAHPGGSNTGTVATTFDCLVSPGLAVIGRLFFTTGQAGCLVQVQTCYPNGVHVVDCENEINQIDPGNPNQARRLGSICVGFGGHEACDPPVFAVEETTWGKIKASYREAEGRRR